MHTSEDTIGAGAKFSGTAIVGNKAYFAPDLASKVGIYDVSDNTFTTKSFWTTDIASKWSSDGGCKTAYIDAVALPNLNQVNLRQRRGRFKI